MTGEQHSDVDGATDSTLDVLWVSTVGGDELHPQVPEADNDVSWSRDLEPVEDRPIHGTVTVEVRSGDDAALLRRLLDRGRALSITSSVGWSQRVCLTSLSGVDTELQPDGDQLAVATYTWVAAAALN